MQFLLKLNSSSLPMIPGEDTCRGCRKTEGNFQIFLQTSQGLEVCFADKLLLFVGSVVIYTKNPIKINLLWMEKFLPGTGKFSIWLVSWDKYNFPSKLKPVLGSATTNTRHSRNCRGRHTLCCSSFLLRNESPVTVSFLFCVRSLVIMRALVLTVSMSIVYSLEMDFISASVVNDGARPPLSLFYIPDVQTWFLF